MKRTNITITIITAALALASCGKSYDCYCEAIPNNPQGATGYFTTQVKGSNPEKAAANCDKKDKEYLQCTLK